MTEHKHTLCRICESLKRTNSKDVHVGEFKPLSWDETLTELGEKLQSIQKQYVDDSVAYNSQGLLLAI